jgi:hypothetical protein
MRRCSAWPSLPLWAGVVACLVATCAGSALAESTDTRSTAEQPLQEVTVTGTRALDHRALSRAVSGFVQSHSAPSTRINQIGRWHQYVCPLVTGLQPAGRDFITRDIVDVARGVGAPTGPVGKTCPITVEIVFTPDPQALLDRVAKVYRPLLGLYPASQMRKVTTFSRPIQAWYETGTRSMDQMQMPIPGMGAGSSAQNFGAGPGAEVPLVTGGQIDSEVTAMGMQPSGTAGSYLGHRIRSEFVHVLIIADSRQLERYPLHSIADYIALLSLTRMAQLDHCAPLPSITDLLAGACATPVPDALTAADRAYLKGLYSADLEQNLNIEQVEVRDQMMRAIEGK